MKNNNLKLGNVETLMHNTRYNNTALGVKSLKASRTGINNTAVGFRSLKNAHNNSNTAIGSFAGEVLQIGNSNILIGSKADVSMKESINQIVIGSNAKGHGDNIMVLGNSETVSIDPSFDNKTNLGSKKYQYKNLYIDGNVYKDGSKIGLNFLTDGKTIYDKTFTYIDKFEFYAIQENKMEDSVPKTVSVGNLFLGKDTGKNIVPQVIALFDDNAAPNTQTGEELSGTRNTGIGFEVLQNSLNSDKATALGYQALKNNNADNNTAIGAKSLLSNTTGSNNTALGDEALTTNTTGRYNTAIGADSLLHNTTGERNTAIGQNSLEENTTGNNNTAIGQDSLLENTTGSNNTAIGQDSLDENTTGSNNTAIGYKAGDRITTGNNNVLIGYKADPLAATGSNEIVIGYNAGGTGNNQIALGNSSITAIKAQVTSITGYSDKRIKKDINDGDLGLDFINKLRPVKYTKINPADYPDELLEKRFKGENPEEKPEDDNQIYDGLIAQEVEQALKDLNKTWSGHSINESDGKQGIQYGALTIPLIKAVQELSKSNSELTERVKELESKNN